MNRDKLILIAVLVIVAAVGVPAFLFSQGEDDFDLERESTLIEDEVFDEERARPSRQSTREAVQEGESDESESADAGDSMRDIEDEAGGLPDEYRAHVFGTITTKDKRPVADAWVALCRDLADTAGQTVQGAPIMVVQTDARGQYLIENAPSFQSLMVRVEHEDHASKFGPRFELQDREMKEVNLIVHDGLALRGRVVDAGGQPIAGAEILVEDRAKRFEMSENANERVGVSDADGRFLIEHVTPGFKRVAARKPPLATAINSTLHLTVETASNELLMTMNAGAHLAGHVVDQTGAAVPEAKVMARALQAGGRIAASSYPPVTCDEKGAFRYDGLEPGKYRLIVFREGHSTRGAQAHAETGRDDVKLVLQRHPVIKGRIVDGATGGSITSFSILAGAQETLNFRSERLTQRFESADGTFEFFAPRATGTIYLFAEAPGYAGGRSKAINLNGGDAEGIEIAIDRGVAVRGTIRGSGGGLGGATVRLLPEDPRIAQQGQLLRALHGAMRKPGYTTRTGADGRWEFPNVRPGSYRMEAWATGHARLLGEDLIRVDNDGDVNLGSFRLPRGGTVTGTVLDPEGNPLSRSTVKLSSHEGLAGMSDYNGTTDSRGVYRIPNVAPGSYWIQVVGGGASNLSAILAGRSPEGRRLIQVGDGSDVIVDFP